MSKQKFPTNIISEQLQLMCINNSILYLVQVVYSARISSAGHSVFSDGYIETQQNKILLLHIMYYFYVIIVYNVVFLLRI